VTAALLALHSRAFRSVRRHRNYRLFFTGQVISVSGTWMQNIALAWVVVRHGSPLAVGALAFFRFLPFTLFGLFAGTIADRLDNRRTVIGTQAAQLVVAAALATTSILGVTALWAFFLLAAVGGTVLVLDAPARQGLTFQMVGRDELPNAVALNSSIFNGSRILGPSIAGVTIAAVGVEACFALNALSFLAVLASLLLMRKDELYPLERGERPSLLRGTREGLGYARRSRRVPLVLGLVLVVSTLGFNFNVILPVLASKTLDAGPRTFGAISACFGAGALIGALLSATLGRASWKVLLGGTMVFGVTQLLLAPVHSVVLAGALLFFTGLSFTLWTSNSNALLQLGAPDYIRGRVIALYYYAFNGIAPLGGLLAGWLCARGGTELSFLVAGLAVVTATLAAGAHTRSHAGRPAGGSRDPAAA
jgi:MFS family permease